MEAVNKPYSFSFPNPRNDALGSSLRPTQWGSGEAAKQLVRQTNPLQGRCLACLPFEDEVSRSQVPGMLSALTVPTRTHSVWRRGPVSCGPTPPSTAVVVVVFMVLALIGLLYFQVSFYKARVVRLCLWLRRLRPRGDYGPCS